MSNQKLESLLEEKGVPFQEYKRIKAHVEVVLKKNNVESIGEHIPTERAFIVMVKVDAKPSVISNLNSELSVLMAEDERLSLKLTAGFSSILPSSERV